DPSPTELKGFEPLARLNPKRHAVNRGGDARHVRGGGELEVESVGVLFDGDGVDQIATGKVIPSPPPDLPGFRFCPPPHPPLCPPGSLSRPPTPPPAPPRPLHRADTFIKVIRRGVSLPPRNKQPTRRIRIALQHESSRVALRTEDRSLQALDHDLVSECNGT